MAESADNEAGGRLRVVVTGATGNIGSAVVDRLAADPTVAEVVGVARRLPKDEPGTGHAGAKVTYVAGDLADEDETALRQAFTGADAVVHLAWLFQPTHDPITTWQAEPLRRHPGLRPAGRGGRAGP